jgi:hypothetical protein
VSKQGESFNTRNGGHAMVRPKYIVADPNGNREQRRAAKKLGVVRAPERCHDECRQAGEAS